MIFRSRPGSSCNDSWSTIASSRLVCLALRGHQLITTYPNSLKREAVEQVFAGTPLRHVAQALEITELLLCKWRRQFQEAGFDPFPGLGRQCGEAAELKRLCDELARVTIGRDVLKKALAIFSHPTK